MPNSRGLSRWTGHLPEHRAELGHRVVLAHTDATLLLHFQLKGDGAARWGLDNVQVTTLDLPTHRREAIDVGGAIVQVVHGPALDPSLAGCSDGTREAFHDPARHPKLAGCLARWDNAKDLRAASTGTACGEGTPACAAPADACARGWHVCGRTDLAELRAIDPTRCLSAGVAQFLAAASICSDPAGACAANAPATCLSEGPCSPAACCGSVCARADDLCDDGVWRDITWHGPPCGAAGSLPVSGVMCCQDP